MLIKRRKARKSDRGIYIQDQELKKTRFKVGTFYRYIIDVKNRKLIILADAEKGNKVSRRDTENGIKPVLDIRRKDALRSFADCDYMQVSIYNDRIVVEGYENANEGILANLKGILRRKVGKVTGIRQLLNLRKKYQVELSLNQLKQVAGCEQLAMDLDSICPVDTQSFNWHDAARVQKKVKQLQIPLKVVSLFAGAGLLDKAWVDSGYEVIWSNEIDKDACNTYKANIGNHVVQGDIMEIDKSDIPQAPVIIGGSPCQGFSNSNRITHYLDNPKNVLVREFIKTVKANNNGRVFVLENVPQILTAGDGAFRNEIYQELSDFEITSGVLNSADFGSAQKRDRAILIGSKIGRIELPEPGMKTPRTVAEAFSGLDESIPNQNDYSVPKAETLERMKHIPQGGNVFDIPESIRPSQKHSDCYRRLCWNKPSIAIVNVRKAMILHPSLNRILSIREVARLFDLPDDFVFKGSLAAMQQATCNGVPLRLGQAVAEKVKEAIINYNRNYVQMES